MRHNKHIHATLAREYMKICEVYALTVLFLDVAEKEVRRSTASIHTYTPGLRCMMMIQPCGAGTNIGELAAPRWPAGLLEASIPHHLKSGRSLPGSCRANHGACSPIMRAPLSGVDQSASRKATAKRENCLACRAAYLFPLALPPASFTSSNRK